MRRSPIHMLLPLALVAMAPGCDGDRTSGRAKFVSMAARPPAPDEPLPPPTSGASCDQVAAAVTANSKAPPSSVKVGGTDMDIDTGNMIKSSIASICRKRAWGAEAKACAIAKTKGTGIAELRSLSAACDLGGGDD